MISKSVKKAILAFGISLVAVLCCFYISAKKTRDYNNTEHIKTFSGDDLFTEQKNSKQDVLIYAAARSSTWGKVFDFENVGLTENNYQAYTYDFNIKNNTNDKIKDFLFKLSFKGEVYLMSAWNGALQIHQTVDGREVIDTVPDLREYVPENHELKSVNVDGDDLIPLSAGDYFIYIPATTVNAKEMPINSRESVTPGFIVYTPIDENIENSVLEMTYRFDREITAEPLFWISLAGLAAWFVALIIFVLTSIQIRKYKQRHVRDNEIINESIETFISFIDAKDPYTNGHSKRVAVYTKQIAAKLGYSGDVLDRIYYIGLLHDCGKIGIPDNILGKPGKLTDEEFEVIKSHTVKGGEILSHFKSLKDVDEGARYHHERYDGKGYPEGKAGEDIPFIARIICVADAFDAMNTNRVYRKKLSRAKIISEIENNKGKQFDPKIADIMLELLKNKEIATSEESEDDV